MTWSCPIYPHLMDWPFFSQAAPFPHPSQSAQQDGPPLSPWRQQSPLRMGSPWTRQSPLSFGSPLWAPSSFSVPSPWRMSTPLMMPLRTPSPASMSPGFRLGDSTGNPNVYRPQNNVPLSQQSISQGTPDVQNQLSNVLDTPSRSFVIPALENVASRQLRTVTPENMLIPSTTMEEHLPFAVFTRSRFSNQEWENHRPQIQKLYLDEGRSLEETKQVMIRDFDFDPS